ncbi:hypothetical protein K469DRAFT_70416 [Zopfia rhizophila CBS 207.26]|uniref:Uncharacterized protein n=1 Tax=Zopfia rhizophila CBS 207.26 TaxID=1314779 RepID=A0A6A6EF33_9PEZI|nr:hypothetical protein K469DRAFT_70416 [Zopfia rhizophila CBS 207.26]
MSAIPQKVSHSGHDGMRGGLRSSLTAHANANANAEPSAASFQTPAPCSLHCNVTTMADTPCEEELPEVMRTKLMPHASDRPRHHREIQSERDVENGADWRAYSTEGAECERRDDWS